MSKTNPQNRKHFQKRCHGDRFVWQTVQIPDLVFRHDKKEYKASRIASINMEQADNVPVYPVTAFRPGVGMKRACDVKVIAIPIREDDDRARCVVGFNCLKCGKTFNARLMGQATLIAHLNPDISTEELLPVGNMIVKVKFRKGTNLPAIANHPETGAFMVPSPDWQEVLGQKLDLSKEYEVAVTVELDGRQVATPVDTVSNIRSTSVALALATKTGFLTEFHETNLVSPHGKWVHMLTALGIKPDKVKSVTKEEVKSAYRQRSKIYNTDTKESSTSAVKPQMLELYKSLQQMVNEAKKMADLYIDKRDGNVAPADAPAEVVPQQEAAQVEVKAPTMVNVVRSPAPAPAQEAVSEKVETEASPSAPADELPETVTDPAPAEEVIATETAPVEVNSNEAAEEPAPAIEEKAPVVETSAPARLAGEELDKLAACMAGMSLEDFNKKSNSHKKLLRQRALARETPKVGGQSKVGGKERPKKEKKSNAEAIEEARARLAGSSK